MAVLPWVVDMSWQRQRMWMRLHNQVLDCSGKDGVESAAHEEGARAHMESARAEDPDVLVAVDGGWEGSLMHMTARRAKTEGLVRCVWECCGERALLLMRYRYSAGWTVLYCLARNPNMTRGMYTVFAEHCTQDDLRAANDKGWSVLFRMAVTFIHDAETQEQEENMASVMCVVVQRLGPGALRAETTEDTTVNSTKYPAGATPRSILHDAGDKGRALLQRLEEAAGYSEAVEPEEMADDLRGSAQAIARSAAAPALADTPPAAVPLPSAAASSHTPPANTDDSIAGNDAAAAISTTQTAASLEPDTRGEPAPATAPSAQSLPTAPPASTPQEVRARCALQLWIVTNTTIVADVESYAAAMVGAGITDEASLQQRFDEDASFLDALISDTEDRAQVSQALSS